MYNEKYRAYFSKGFYFNQDVYLDRPIIPIYKGYPNFQSIFN